jgi:hypothetical protein
MLLHPAVRRPCIQYLIEIAREKTLGQSAVSPDACSALTVNLRT